MSLTLEFSQEEQAAYEAQARAEGLSMEAWLKKLADERARVSQAGLRVDVTQGKSLVDLCAKVRGLTDDLDTSRNASIARSIDR